MDSFMWLLFFNYHSVSRSLTISGHVLDMPLEDHQWTSFAHLFFLASWVRLIQANKCL